MPSCTVEKFLISRDQKSAWWSFTPAHNMTWYLRIPFILRQASCCSSPQSWPFRTAAEKSYRAWSWHLWWWTSTRRRRSDMYRGVPTAGGVSLDSPLGRAASAWYTRRETHTLKLMRAFTLSPRTSAMCLSKWANILLASWGSMRAEVTKSSRTSASDVPRLLEVSMPYLLRDLHSLSSTCRAGTARSTGSHCSSLRLSKEERLRGDGSFSRRQAMPSPGLS